MDVGLATSPGGGEHHKSSVDKIAEKEILRKLKHILPKGKIEVEIISPERANIYVNEKQIPKIIGKNGKRIAKIEKEIGISLGVETLKEDESHIPKGKMFEVEVIETHKQIILDMGNVNSGSNFDVFIDGEYLLTATTSRQGEIKIKKGIELASIIEEAIDYDLHITACKK